MAARNPAPRPSGQYDSLLHPAGVEFLICTANPGVRHPWLHYRTPAGVPALSPNLSPAPPAQFLFGCGFAALESIFVLLHLERFSDHLNSADVIDHRPYENKNQYEKQVCSRYFLIQPPDTHDDQERQPQNKPNRKEDFSLSESLQSLGKNRKTGPADHAIERSVQEKVFRTVCSRAIRTGYLGNMLLILCGLRHLP